MPYSTAIKKGQGGGALEVNTLAFPRNYGAIPGDALGMYYTLNRGHASDVTQVHVQFEKF